MEENIKALNLHEKMLRIANIAGALRKSKKGFNYSYVPEPDIQAKVTSGLQKYGVMLYTSLVPGTLLVQELDYDKYDPKIKGNKHIHEMVVTGESEYTWVNVDNPSEVIKTTWGFAGQMEDVAQAMGAALTYSNRYYLMKQLQLATTEDDPDNYRSKQMEAEAEEDRLAQAKAEIELKKRVAEVVEAGTRLIGMGAKPTVVRTIVEKYNNGEGSPSSITDIEVCGKVMKALNDEQKKLETAPSAKPAAAKTNSASKASNTNKTAKSTPETK